MKTLILWMLVLTIASVSNAQKVNVNIPDRKFKNALISAGIDANKDGEIHYGEAEAINSLDVGSNYISDMTGIEAFVNLDTLNCRKNKLTSLDVSKNIALKCLSCDNNQLTSLDVSNNTTLTDLGCGGNQLTGLDISNNIALTNLGCYNNQITSLNTTNNTALEYLSCGENLLTSLDVSNNTALIVLYCSDNQLTSLDVSKNIALKDLYCKGNQLSYLNISKNINLFSELGRGLGFLDVSFMPTLYEVCVYEIPFPSDTIGNLEFDDLVDTTGSPNINFTTDCVTNFQSNYTESTTIDIYPNPSDDLINIEIENTINATIEIYNVSGRLVFSKELYSVIEKIDISGFPKGIYIVKVMQDRTVNIGKVVVR